jgi:hypothetical protein
VPDVLSPFDIHRFLPKKLRGRYFQSAAGNFCRGLSGSLQQFGKGMAQRLAVSYSGLRHLWLGNDLTVEARSYIARCLDLRLFRLQLYVLRGFQQLTAVLNQQVQGVDDV